MPQLLSQCEVDFALLPHLKGWTCRAKAISKDYECRDSEEAEAFAEAVRDMADEMEVNPDIRLHDRNRVLLTLRPHEIGGLTDGDIRLARQIDVIAPVGH